MSELKLVKVGEFLRYDFSEDEMRERSKKLALAVQTQVQAQEEQKAAQAQFKERIESCVSQIGRLSRDINMGWEMRTIDCRVDFHTPVVGTKRITRLDTGELVREIAMLTSELQENLFPKDSSENIDSFFGSKFSDALASEMNNPDNPLQALADKDGVSMSLSSNGKTIAEIRPRS